MVDLEMNQTHGAKSRRALEQEVHKDSSEPMNVNGEDGWWRGSGPDKSRPLHCLIYDQAHFEGAVACLIRLKLILNDYRYSACWAVGAHTGAPLQIPFFVGADPHVGPPVCY